MKNLATSTADTGRLIGYARVSTVATASRRERGKAQHVDNQVARLYDAGCEIVFTDEVSGKDASRPRWDKCLAYLRPGDTLMFTKLDRIGRSLHNLVEVVEDLRVRHVNLRSLDQGIIDTTTPHGHLLFAIMAAVAQFEADINRERTAEGLEAARERHGGKLPPRGRAKAITDEKLRNAARLLRSGVPTTEVARTVGLSRSTVYRLVVPGVRAAKAEAAS
jgi:DNA invertase Pin-like site-specific DNA recombinase